MEILDLIDAEIKIEYRIGALYGRAADKAGLSNPGFVAQLETLAGEEIGHANVLRMGRDFVVEMPDLFSSGIDVGELQGRLQDAERTLGELWTENDLKALLTRLLELEKQFERLHLTQSVLIKDESLKSLFVTLSKGDSGHIDALSGILSQLAT